VTVYLCRDAERLANGPDLAALAGWLAEREPRAEVRMAPGPCDHPERWLEGEGTRAERPVLAVCAADGARSELQARARRLGFDPVAVEIVDLGAASALAHDRAAATRGARAQLAAALARSRAYRAGQPESTKPVLTWDREVSRRSLFTLPPIRWDVVPAIRDEACAAGRGCRVCATACPHGALAFAGGRMTLGKPQCTGCGACVSACPVGAVELPGASLVQVEAQLDALLAREARDGSPAGILFLCHASAPSLARLPRPAAPYPVDWMPVELPCLGMVTPGWVLQCLAGGAAAVGMLACRSEDCRFGRRETIAGRLAYCREFLRALGAPGDAVRFADVTDERALLEALARPLAAAAAPDGAAHLDLQPDRGALAQALGGLARRHGGAPAPTLDHAESPLGVVTLAPGCTACGACALACPTGALALEHAGADLSLSFDGARCTACGVCAPVCPEKVVRLDRRTDLAALARGRQALHRDHVVRCEKCGGPVATRALLERFRTILGGDPALATISRYCEACRGSIL